MTTVFLTDTNLNYHVAREKFIKAARWARKNCSSYTGHNIQDVADFSYTNDLIAAYHFDSEQDVTLFVLKWQ
jgi:hypothetical protein